VVEHKSVYEAIQAVYGEVGYVQKEENRNLNYTFASEAGFIRALRPAFITHGLIVRVVNMGVVQLENYETSKGTAMVRAVITAQIEFIHAPTGTAMQVQSLGEGADSGDKAVNKAMTDCYKYALRQAFMIETGDDPDQSQPEERKSSKGGKPAGLKEAAQELGGVPSKSEKVELTYEEASAVTAEDGTPYGKLKMEELTTRFNSMTKYKKDNPDKFTQEHAMKMAAIKVLIANYKDVMKTAGDQADRAAEELFGGQGEILG